MSYPLCDSPFDERILDLVPAGELPLAEASRLDPAVLIERAFQPVDRVPMSKRKM